MKNLVDTLLYVQKMVTETSGFDTYLAEMRQAALKGEFEIHDDAASGSFLMKAGAWWFLITIVNFREKRIWALLPDLVKVSQLKDMMDGKVKLDLEIYDDIFAGEAVLEKILDDHGLHETVDGLRGEDLARILHSEHIGRLIGSVSKVRKAFVIERDERDREAAQKCDPSPLAKYLAQCLTGSMAHPR